MQILDEFDGLDGAPLLAHFEELCRDVRATQEEFLRQVLQANAGTRFGREHGFSEMAGSADYRARVPLSEWSDYAASMDALAAGEDGVLLAVPPVWFVATSGTTGKPKMLPETGWSRKADAITMRLRRAALLRDHPRVLQGRVVALALSPVQGRTPRGIPWGPVSGATLADTPRPLLEKLLAFPLEVAQLPPTEDTDYCVMRFAVEHSVTMLVANNPMRFSQLFQLAESRRDDILRDIEQGTLSARVSLQLPLSPNPERARQLASMAMRPAEYWPDLELLLCWTGGTMGQFLPEALRWCSPRVKAREFGYGASEGKFTIPVDDSPGVGVLAPYPVFYEFLPAGSTGETLLADEVEVGGTYELVLTNTMGLYRYRLHDLVRVTGRHGTAPVLQFLQKSGDLGNIAGEKMSAEVVRSAMRILAERRPDLRARHFQVIPRLSEARYELALEPEAEGAVLDDGAAALFDEVLSQESPAYLHRREQHLLQEPSVVRMAPGWREAIIRDTLARRGGTRDQLKLPVFRDDLPCAEFAQERVE